MINDSFSDKTVSVDGTDYQIRNQTPFWKGWYSHKFLGPGVRYEIALGITTGYIVWINGPFPCSCADITIFRMGLKSLLYEAGEKAEADRGYRGEKNTISLPSDDVITWKDKWQKNKIRSRHETVNTRLKNWNCLGNKFRHDIRKHSCVFRAVAVLTQLSMQYGGRPLFKIETK